MRSMLSRSVLAAALAGIGLPAAALCAALWRYGTLDGVYAGVRGEAAYASPATISLRVQPGYAYDLQLCLGNASSRDMTILDATSSCSCLEIHPESHIVPARGLLRVPARLTVSKEAAGEQPVVIKFALDGQEQIVHSRLNVTVRQ